MSAQAPNKCTGWIAHTPAWRFSASSTWLGSMLKVTGSISTKTGSTPSRASDPAVAKNEYGVVMTLSPGPNSSAIHASKSASLPEAQAIAYFDCV